MRLREWAGVVAAQPIIVLVALLVVALGVVTLVAAAVLVSEAIP